ncbi:hypothetical protein EGW08_000950, partial [Elysia chlorotica]
MAASPSYKYRIFNKRETGNRLNHSFDMGESSQFSRNYRDSDYHDGIDGNRPGSTSNGPNRLDRSFDTGSTAHASELRQSHHSPTRRPDRSLDASFHNHSSSNGTTTRKVDRSFDASYYLHNKHNDLPSFSFSAAPSSSKSADNTTNKFHNQSFDASHSNGRGVGGLEDGGRFHKNDRLNRSFDGRSFERTTTRLQQHPHHQQQQQPQSPTRNWTTTRTGEILDRSPDRRDSHLDRSFRAFNQAFPNGGVGDFDEPLSLPVHHSNGLSPHSPLSPPGGNGTAAGLDTRGRAPTRSALRSSDRSFEKRAREERYVVRRTGVSLDRGSSLGNLNRSFTSPGVSWKTHVHDGDGDGVDDGIWPRERPISFRSMVRLRREGHRVTVVHHWVTVVHHWVTVAHVPLLHVHTYCIWLKSI